jgi:hypothetical protein
LYEENARMLRYFLSSRQVMLSGYFVILGALAMCFKWSLTHCSKFAILFPSLGAIIAFTFYLFDLRNRDLIRHTTNVGRNIEDEMNVGLEAYFTGYTERKARIRHARILDTVYLGTAVLMLILALVGIFKGFSGIMEGSIASQKQ